jgi:hypothetical protein
MQDGGLGQSTDDEKEIEKKRKKEGRDKREEGEREGAAGGGEGQRGGKFTQNTKEHKCTHTNVHTH